jgi:hypothetical protein
LKVDPEAPGYALFLETQDRRLVPIASKSPAS